MAIGTVLAGVCAGLLFWAIPALFQKWVAAGFTETHLEGLCIGLFWFVIPPLSLTLYGLHKWFMIPQALWTLSQAGPLLPRGVLLIQHKSGVCMRLPNPESGTAFILIFVFSFLALPVAFLLHDLQAPPWLVLAGPSAALLALFSWRLQWENKQTKNGCFDLIIDQKNQTLRVPVSIFKRAPITLKLDDPYEILVEVTELGDSEGTTTFYLVSLRHPSLSAIPLHQWRSLQDAKLLAQLLHEKTGLRLVP